MHRKVLTMIDDLSGLVRETEGSSSAVSIVSSYGSGLIPPQPSVREHLPSKTANHNSLMGDNQNSRTGKNT
jgi:hypothetical protein